MKAVTRYSKSVWGLLLLSLFTPGAAMTQELTPDILAGLNTGYKDTPMLPGERWHVHDPDRPKPPVVTPGADAGRPPSDAIILFAGRDLSAFVGTDGKPADWTVRDGVAAAPARASHLEFRDIRTRESFGDVQLHLEFREPDPPTGKGQMRGNSGVIFMGLYEIQILDSFENPTYADGQASAIYGWRPPLVNASRAPGEWQTYDILFQRPRFGAAGKTLKPAFVTVFHNGVVTQANQMILGKTGWRTLPTYSAHADALPLVLQDHGSSVSFRNIWVRRLDTGDAN